MVLEPGIGPVKPRGSRVVTPDQSTKYRLLAYGKRGRAEATVQWEVISPPPKVSLEAHPLEVQRGRPVTLQWTSDNAADVSVSPGVGRVGLSGTIQVYPENSQTYIAVARGEAGSAQAQATVTVTEPPQIVTLSIPAGTQLEVRLVDTLSSQSSRPGETFQATLDQSISVSGRLLIPKHSEVVGRIQSVSPSGRIEGVAQMALVISEIRAGNQTYTVYVEPLQLVAKSKRGKDSTEHCNRDGNRGRDRGYLRSG